jgi:hypothetical protein
MKGLAMRTRIKSICQLPIRFAILIIATCMVSSALTHAAQPNIVLCMADDQGWGDTAYNGHPLLKTPHLGSIVSMEMTISRQFPCKPLS